MRPLPERAKRLRETARADSPTRRRPQPELGAKSANSDGPEAVRRRYAALVTAMDGFITEADAGVLEFTARAQAEIEQLDALLEEEG